MGQRWKKGGALLAMMTHLKRIRRLQRFIRWSLRHINEVRSRLETLWSRLEKDILLGQAAHAAGAHANHGHQADGGQQHLRHWRHVRHSITLAFSIPPVISEGQSAEADETHLPAQRHISRTSSMLVGRSSCLRRDRSEEHHRSRHTACASNVNGRRRRFLRQELHNRRKKYLARYEVWRGDMQLYWRDVHAWRDHYKACKLRGKKSSMEMPERPPCPSHIPTEAEITEWAKKLLTNKLQEPETMTRPGLTNAPGQRGARVGRMASAASAAVAKRRMAESQEAFKASPVEGQHHLCEEVAELLAPTATKTVPVATEFVHRPLMESPV